MITRTFSLSKRRLLAGSFSALVFALAGGKAASAKTNPALSVDDIQDLDRVSAYLNDLKTLTGGFTQIDSRGQAAEGVFFLRRPGKARFEYTKPKTQGAIISDGTWLLVQDTKLKTAQRYPLNSTPLSILLRKKVDLAGETRIVAVERAPGLIAVTARDDKGVAQGELTLVFSEPSLELRNWTIKDAQGGVTTVALRDVRRGVALDPKLFEIKVDKIIKPR
jgi:outer membrane lipoprotein-sorting protein